MIRAFSLPATKFVFGGGNLHSDKLRGLQEYGPFRQVESKIPRFAFLFPTEYREKANSLYLALKNGVGYFPGVENVFRYALRRTSVSSVGTFSIAGKNAEEQVRAYIEALRAWLTSAGERVDLVFIILPQHTRLDASGIYYRCKALLLREGLLSQGVTPEVIDDPASFEWAVANIALGAFAKLGGVPWVVSGESAERDLVIGVGRSDLFDPESRSLRQYLGFTACFSARGPLKFMSLGDVADSPRRYLDALDTVVRRSLERARSNSDGAASVSVHVPKEMGRVELQTIKDAVKAEGGSRAVPVSVAKVTDESNFFAIDQRFPDGVPRKGIAIQITDREFLLYTEGRDEKDVWRGRAPGALRIGPQGGTPSDLQARTLLAQIYHLSQVNWRGFNARARPISVHYGSQIAEILSHLSADEIRSLQSPPARNTLEQRMWFL
jgi:hypothetical protein